MSDQKQTSPTNDDRCVICGGSTPSHQGGLCPKHTYDEDPPENKDEEDVRDEQRTSPTNEERWQAEKEEIYAAHAQLIANQRRYHEAEVRRLYSELKKLSDLRKKDLHNCHCVDVEIGTYANQVSMKCPYINDDRDGWVCIDTCIATEIGWLWHQGVHTLNSCCGHGKHRSGVIVNIEHETLMESLGYDEWDLSHTGHHRIYRLRTGTQVLATEADSEDAE